MKSENVTEREFERLLRSIDKSSQSTSESIAEIKDYMLHNDYRHAATEAEVKTLKADVSIILEVLESRSPMWRTFKKGKWAVSVLAAGILAAAGTGIYNYIIKPQPVINQHKEKPKIEIKEETKDLIE